jgi:hypothetical protein
MAGSTGVAPAYVDLESTRSHCDPPPAFQLSIPNNSILMDTTRSYHGSAASTTIVVSPKITMLCKKKRDARLKIGEKITLIRCSIATGNPAKYQTVGDCTATQTGGAMNTPGNFAGGIKTVQRFF